MKKKLIICFTLFILGLTSVSAQGILDKVGRALDKTDKAANQADRSNKALDKITDFSARKRRIRQKKAKVDKQQLDLPESPSPH